MNRQEWEQDIRNRQRNIVFPDTNLNEGRFYRNIVSGKAVFSLGQKISLLAMVLFFVLLNAITLAEASGGLVHGDMRAFPAWSLEPSIIAFLWLGFWIFLAIKALFPEKPERKRRRGYRTSSRG
jgi:hypothetical protein